MSGVNLRVFEIFNALYLWPLPLVQKTTSIDQNITLIVYNCRRQRGEIKNFYFPPRRFVIPYSLVYLVRKLGKLADVVLFV